MPGNDPVTAAAVHDGSRSGQRDWAVPASATTETEEGGAMGLMRSLVFVALFVGLVVGCAADDAVDPVVGSADRTSTTLEGSSGAVITVTGRVSRLVDTHLFSVGEEGGPPVLVVWSQRDAGVRPGRTVEVTGSVRDFRLPDLEDELRIEIDERRTGDLDGDPVLVATAVRLDP